MLAPAVDAAGLFMWCGAQPRRPRLGLLLVELPGLCGAASSAHGIPVDTGPRAWRDYGGGLGLGRSWVSTSTWLVSQAALADEEAAKSLEARAGMRLSSTRRVPLRWVLGKPRWLSEASLAKRVVEKLQELQL